MDNVVEHPLTKEIILSFIRENKPHLFEKFGVIKIALFGSYARDEQTEQSDIDLAIETNDFSFNNLCALKHFLEDHFKKTVDISYFEGMRAFIRNEIEKELMYA